MLTLRESSAQLLKKTWDRHFRICNLVAQFAAVGLGIVLGILTVQMYLSQGVASWLAPGGHLHFAGYVYVYVYCIVLLYAMIIFYVTRCIIISLFLRALVRCGPLRILPLHPDKCGGLRPVGRQGLRNQYTLTVLSINIVLLLVIWASLMHRATSFGHVMIAGSAAYLILGPVIFMAPLLPFRAGMQNAKKEWTHEFARVVRVEIDHLREQITRNKVTEFEEKSIERLREGGRQSTSFPSGPSTPGPDGSSPRRT